MTADVPSLRDQYCRRADFWEGLLAQDPAEQVFAGRVRDYWGSGRRYWEIIRGHIPDLHSVLDWGAGGGRVARAAADDCEFLVAYEPTTTGREIMRAELGGLSNLIIMGPEILKQLWAQYSAIYLANVAIHLDYDDLYQLAHFARHALYSDGVLIMDHWSFDGGGEEVYRETKYRTKWPMYVWDPEQLDRMFRAFALEPVTHVPPPIEGGRMWSVYRNAWHYAPRRET